jgi:DNA primase
MRFSPQFLDQIRARVNISSVVGKRVQWDRRKTQAAKGDYWACCPFHTEKSPSFHADDRKGIYYCFGCKASGDIFSFLTEKEGMRYPEAVAQLAQDAGLAMPTYSAEEEEREVKRASLYDVMALAQSFFEAELQTARGAKARGYLSDRDLSPAVQQQFGIGYAPDDRSALRTHLAAKDITVDQMAEAGLVVSGDDIPVAYDRFRDRVMFPIRDPRGRVIAFGGRALRADVPAKYLNSPETPIFSKGEVLYNFDKARSTAHEKSRIIAVEGYVDVIAMARAGFTEAVAPLGTALTDRQLAILWRTAAEPILCFDGDSAGQKAAYRALDLALPLLQPGHSLRFAFLPEGKDPDDLLRAEGAEAVQAVIGAALPMAQVLWQRALDENDRTSPERRAAFEKDLRILVSTIQDETVRRHYQDDVRERLAQLFQKQSGGMGQGGQGRRYQSFAPQPARRLRPGQRAWDVQMPASSRLKAAASVSTQSRAEKRERMILLSVINHPELLHAHWDDVAGADLSSREHENLRQFILDVASSHEAVSPEAFRVALNEKGFAEVLARLEDQAKRLNEWYLSADAAVEDAQTAFTQMLALHRKSVTLERELRSAEAAFANDATEANLQSLIQLREQVTSATGAEARIAGFGAASGRVQEDV